VVDLLERLKGITPANFSPGAFFLDAEGELDGVIAWQGQKLHLRGKPDAIVIPPGSHPEICEYKFGQQGQMEYQIAQVLLYLHLLRAAKGVDCKTGRLMLFRVEPDEESVSPREREFPAAVDAAFSGYIGNQAAVRRLKIECSNAHKRGAPLSMPVNFMFCGPGGLGKTELARRVANALGLPFVNIPARNVANVDDLMLQINKILELEDQKAESIGTDSGLPLVRYPPLVIFLDEVHELGKKADAFLNMFEPKEKRAVGKKQVGNFKAATILAATTDKGRLPPPFRTRFRMVDLEPYTVEQVADMLRALFASVGPAMNDEFLLGLARRGRLNPRIAIERTNEMISHHEHDPNQYPLSQEGLDHVSTESWQVDKNGLNVTDRCYLRSLAAGNKGFNALVSSLQVGKEEIAGEIEPYLLQMELIRLTRQGRELTERGRLLLGT
jgi:Holliday junction resolvasome RuvABC ATP-dependent DNA helicase subunit